MKYNRSLLVLLASIHIAQADQVRETAAEFHQRIQESFQPIFDSNQNTEVQAWWLAVSDPLYGDLYWVFGDYATLEDHLYIGSISKTFGATTTLLLGEDNVLSLDDTAAGLVPELDVLFPDYANYTIAQLLGMQTLIPDYLTNAGIDNFGEGYWFKVLSDPTLRFTQLELVDFATQDGDGLSDPPPSYSSTNYVLLDFILETITSVTMSQLIEDRVLHPLELHETALPLSNGSLPLPVQAAFAGDTCYELPQFVGIDMAMLGIPKYTDLSPLASSYIMSGSAAGMYSTAPDLLKWANAGFGDELLSEESAKKRYDFQYLGDGLRYGLGLIPVDLTDQSDGPSQVWYGHGGSSVGSEALAYHNYELNASFVSVVDSCFFQEMNEFAMEAYQKELVTRELMSDAGPGTKVRVMNLVFAMVMWIVLWA